MGSVDPLLVFFHDGYVRIGYNETLFYNQLLDESVATFSQLAEYLEHNPRMHQYRRSMDPMEHIRNQVKESTSLFVEAFKDTTFKLSFLTNNSIPTMRYSFEIYAFDFV